MLVEDCVGRCDRDGMVGPTQNVSSSGKEERIAKYKEERRRQLAAQFGPRDNHQVIGAIRSTRASRLRTQANSESIKGSKDPHLKDGETCAAVYKTRLIKPSSPQLPEISTESYLRKCTMVSPNLGGFSSPKGVKKPSSTATQSSSSPIPRSSQLVKRASLQERESSPVSAPPSQSPRDRTSSSPHKPASVFVGGRISPASSSSPSHQSILKKNLTEEVLCTQPSLSTPVSILKRKTAGENSATQSRCHSPLRFSPNTVDKRGRGILKKHRSLDETHVVNGDVELSNGVNENEEPKPILKSQGRRCSLEEVFKRTLSPEPQGILKRKASREEADPPAEPPPHPTGILKKKSSVTEEPSYEYLDSPRPILKKKSLSEDEEHTVKPILKVASRKSLDAADEPEPKREEIKPILKHPEETVTLRPRKSNGEKRVTSLDLSLFSRPSSSGEGSPLSVAERVSGLETLLNIKRDEFSLRMEEGDGSSEVGLVRRGSVTERATIFNQLDQKEKAAAEAAKTRRNLKGPRSRNRTEGGSRFCTQPVTFDEVEQAKRNNDPDCDEDPSKLSLAQRVKLFSSLHSSDKPANGNSTSPIPASSPQPVSRKLVSSPLMSGILVEGLMKNLAGKDGAPVKLPVNRSVGSRDSSSSDSSDSEVDGCENGDDGARRSLLSSTKCQQRVEESSSEDASSGGREVQDILFRQPSVRKSNSSAGEMMGEVTALRRCATQPIPRDEVDDLPKTTIAERLAALRKNGNTNWMKRIEKPIEEIISAKPPSGGGSRLTERLGQLETASQNWKARIGPQDAQQFTVAGKMSSESPALPPQPKLGLASRKPTPIVFTNKGIASASVPSVPDSLAELMKRSISVPEGDDEKGENSSSCVQVPHPYDEDFAAFFPETDFSRLTSDMDVDFDAITVQSHDLLVQRRTVKVQRKHRSVNPIKALQSRKDLKTEYVEIKSGVADREIRRMNIEKMTKSCGLAVEALAGLASKEDITGVALRKAGEGSPATRQWTHPLLLRVKGRRHPLTSIVRPHYTSINQGDSFVLVTQNHVYHWVGEFCNVIEKSRGADIAQHIESEKDLGCTGASNVITLDGSSFSEKHRQFWKTLSLPDDMMMNYNGEGAGHPGEDEVYEKAVSETYMAYQLDDDKLVPVNEFWGRCPKIEVLDSSKVLVFDFTSEVYMWAGKNADMPQRKKGTELAQKLFKNLCEAHVSWKSTGIHWLDKEMEAKSRPEYSIFARITQHMEPILFREKFVDWPDFTKVIRSSTSKQPLSTRKVDGSVDARPCDAKSMIKWNLPSPDLVLEGTHLGRGTTYYDADRMLHYDVATQELQMWTLHGCTKSLLPSTSVGHFLDTESYVIRWKYNVKANARELSGLPSKHTDVGRDRLAYFVWHGAQAPVVDQGTAALLTACPEDPEDKDHGPITTLRHGGDSPAFATMFPGPIVFHNSSYTGPMRLFLITGEDNCEGRLEEVEPSLKSLRSRASLLYLNTDTSQCYLWHGVKCPTNNRSVASTVSSYLAENPSRELRLNDPANMTVVEIEEGDEPEDFFGGYEVIDRQMYCSLLDSEINVDWTPRLFHLSSMYGEFTASPVVPLRFDPSSVTPYPYSKEDLYSTSQPSLMLLDLDSSLYLWTGWWEGDLDSRGSVWGRYGAERIAALTTALHYWDLRGKSARDVQIVCAGLEPSQFKTAFAVWESSSQDRVAREFNLNEGHCEGEIKSAQDELRGLTRIFPIAELTSLPLPAGVDPTRLEEYLDDADFENFLGVGKEEYKELPSWKKANLKKKAGLF